VSQHDDETRLQHPADVEITRLRPDGSPVQAGRLAPGQLFGPFRIVRELGRGGMGEVYEAHVVETNQRVALKTLSRSFGDREVRDRFLREGRLAASVSHPNSVYVYGSYDIDGVPAISMELVGGGTLEDLVKARGRLTPLDAVKAVVQLIAGLEAAESRGVLHRDIKPSNAFIDAHGVVKIGDYGISLSLTSADETRLTSAGLFIGTPAYASPEQVRGLGGDVRSDIYSVGATLYYLLTGRSPFDRGNAVQTLAAVVADAPESPRQLATDIPPGLSEVVLRCLRKDPSARYASYADLRQALLPFSQPSLPAAQLLHRLAAMAVDSLIFVPVIAVLGLITAGTPLAPMAGTALIGLIVLFEVAYFGLLEGRYGASVGKRLYGLRVVTTSGAPIGIGRGVGRAAIWVAIMAAGDAVDQQLPLALLVFFITARRATGYRGIHEIASGTRTVRAAPIWSIRRKRTARSVARPQAASSDAVRAGAFVVTERLWESGDHALDAAWDPALERDVWIHRVPPGSSPLGEVREQLAREGRLRWLVSRRSADEHWDAYEAPEGNALGVLPWNHVLSIVKDLAIEMHAGLNDGSLPRPLSTSQVWVSDDGVGRITEFDLPGAAASEPMHVTDAATAARFLAEVARVGLGGQLGLVPLPLAVRSALDDLEAAKFPTITAVVDRLDEAARSAPLVSKPRRLLALGFGGFVAAFTLAVTSMTTIDAYRLHREPALEELGLLAARLQFLEDEGESPADQWMSRNPASRYTADARRAFRVWLGDRHGALIADASAWERLDDYWDDLDDKREFAEKARTEAMAASPEERAQAREGAAPIVGDFEQRQRERSNFWLDQLFRVQSVLGQALAVVGLFAVVGALLTGGSIVLRLLGLGIAGPDGRAASWLRAWFRTVIAWAPALVGYAVFLWGFRSADAHAAVAPSVLAVTNAMMIGGFVLTAWKPELSIQDRLAGTRVVPK
jgi:uncharacterized RDD family membrane protein YckC